MNYFVISAEITCYQFVTLWNGGLKEECSFVVPLTNSWYFPKTFDALSIIKVVVSQAIQNWGLGFSLYFSSYEILAWPI